METAEVVTTQKLSQRRHGKGRKREDVLSEKSLYSALVKGNEEKGMTRANKKEKREKQNNLSLFQFLGQRAMGGRIPEAPKGTMRNEEEVTKLPCVASERRNSRPLLRI